VQEACVKVAGVREESGESAGRRGRNLKSTLLAVLLLSFLASSTWAQQTRPKEENAARVLAMESLWNQAELQKDVQALDQLLSDKFIYVDVDGSLKTKPEFLKGVKNPPEHIGTIASESLAAEVYDTTVVVSGIYREKGTNHGTAYSRRGRFTDTWVKQGKSWLCVASQSTLIQK
jgi:ketosteroid isomerase-like protein